ncbi:ck1 family protein kinase [Stylonychia lemnae]|uniref:Casein kinase I n=1 Tax=Stylonychia lemnae TaxID=5949 RepID=A0A078A150_STYLE|nr:ck1 family protein kinase [Stylonychia lemnae]|eukprot:CDW75213.1 ck1 family protein kinase [Stylonychia lemnae]
MSISQFKESDFPKTLRGYQYECILGNGTYGVVCKYNKDGASFAVKFESQYSNTQMIQEKQRLKMIDAENQKIQDENLKIKAPKIILDGSIRAQNNSSITFNYIILDFLSQSIFDGQQYLSKSNLAVQMIQQLENLHAIGIVHRDVKLENFMINNNQVYLIDLGASKEYLVKNEFGETSHLPLKTQCSIMGTPYTASLNSHRCIEVVRADDLISVIYSLIWLWDDSFPMKVQVLQSIERNASVQEQFAICYQLKQSLRASHLSNFPYLQK